PLTVQVFSVLIGWAMPSPVAHQGLTWLSLPLSSSSTKMSLVLIEMPAFRLDENAMRLRSGDRARVAMVFAPGIASTVLTIFFEAGSNTWMRATLPLLRAITIWLAALASCLEDWIESALSGPSLPLAAGLSNTNE